jgi:hypothetical protein
LVKPTRALLLAVVCVALAASAAHADIGIRAVQPSTAQVGDLVRVTARGFLGEKPWPAMRVVFVKASAAPTPFRCGERGICRPRLREPQLRRSPFVWVGAIRRWRAEGSGRGSGELTFRVPRVEPARYVVGLYCAACTPGACGSLIIDPRLTLVVRRR